MPLKTLARRSPLLISILIAAALSACGGPESSGDPVAAAKASMDKGEIPAAIVQLKAALQKDPNLGGARFLLGSALLRTGDASAAIVELDKAHEAGHGDDEVVPALARAMLALGQTKKLIERFAEVALSKPAAVADLKSSLAVAHGEQNNLPAAKAAIGDALAALPTHGPALLLRANLKAGSGDVDGAIADVRSILERDAKNVQAQHFLGLLQLHGKGDAKVALDSFAKAIEIEPRFAQSHKAIIMLHLQNKDMPSALRQHEQLRKVLPNHSQTVHLGAILAYMQEDFKGARESVQKLIRSAPQSAPLQFLAGMVEYQSNALLQAETHLSKGLQSHPESAFARRLLAHVYLRTGQGERALTTIAPLLQSSPVEAETFATAAEIQLFMGNAAQAEIYYTAAAKLAPEHRRARTAMALIKVSRGDRDGGFAELESLSKGDDEAYSDLALVSARMRLKDFDGALRAVDVLQAKQPRRALPLVLKSRIQEAKQDAVGARSSLEAALTIDPANLAAAGRLADYDLLDKKPEQAVKRFDGVLKADPKSSGAQLALAEIRRLQGGKPDELAALYEGVIRNNPTEARARVLLVNHHLRLGDVKRALEVAQAAGAALPNNAQVLNVLGEALLKAGDFNQALSMFTRLASQQPKAPYPHFRIAEVQLSGNDRASALKSLSRAVELAPDYLPAQRAQVAIFAKSGQFDPALKVARVIQSQRAKQDIGFLLEGDVESARSRWEAAAKAYRAALALGSSVEAATKLHKVLVVGGKAGEAEQFANSWIKQQPTGASFLTHLGDTALTAGDMATAEARYREAVRVDPKHATAWNNLAHLVIMKKGTGALAMAEKANELAPGRPAMMDTLALALAADGKFERAIELQKKVVALAPASPLYALNLAKIYIQAGDKGRARAELERLSRVDAAFPGKAEVAKLLASL